MENSRPDNSEFYDRPSVRTKEFMVCVSISQVIEAEDEELAREFVDRELSSDWTIDEVDVYKY